MPFKTFKNAIPFFLFLMMFNFNSCQNNRTDSNKTRDDSPKRVLSEGRWRATLRLSETETLPFNFDLFRNPDNTYKLDIINADERIKVTDISIVEDSITITLPVFGSQIKGKFNDRRILGSWFNYAKGPDYQLDFYAIFGDSTRFDAPIAEYNATVSGRWAVMFIADDKKSKTDAIGVFEQEGTKVTGTFLTSTGDYRFLEGIIADRDLMLSCFDGAHAFLFKAYVNDEGDLDGHFWSGNHSHEIWIGIRDDTVSMPDPFELTRLKSNKNKLVFTLPDISNKQVSLTDEQFNNKVTLVQIMGTWCPNCMDETAFYVDLYDQYKDKGLEIIAVAFEAGESLDKAKPAIERYIKHFNIQYPVVYGGKASKSKALEAFPVLNSFTSFPTTLFLDRQGNIRKIHTGFMGPATGIEFETYKQEIHKLLQELLKESS
ncbi:MAG: TlpA family protein disulfide reductase [Sphingobacteriales bacterium]|nr:MAG: TlpA family protein disulfide reductase [Sphingobacteriales bacterium]